MFRKNLEKITSFFEKKLFKIGIDYSEVLFKEEPHLDKDFLKITSNVNKIYKNNAFNTTNYTAYSITKNIINQNIPGCIVECGVYQGQKISVILETLKLLKSFNRNIYLIDTFEGMTEPSDIDYQVIAGNKMKKKDMFCSLDQVKKNIFFSDYPSDKIIFNKIDVRDTVELKNKINETISILRLDTDFYDSTYSILNAFYDKVEKNGYLIHDDYGHWKGHYEACQKFYLENSIKPVLIRTSRKERLEIKS